MPIDMEAVKANMDNQRRFFEGVGRFLFEFSQLELTIRVLLANKLKLKEEQFDVVTSPYDFRMLCAVTREISCLQHPERSKEFNELFSECLTLNNQRNIIAHGTLTHDFDAFSARHVSRQTLKAEFHSLSDEKLAQLADKSQRLMKAVMGFESN